MTVTTPTILTLLRLLASPALAVVFMVLPRPLADWVALFLFVGVSATDWIDGYLARAWNQVSRLGTMLDPIADKAMVTSALLTLCAVSSLNWAILFPAILILFREVFISGLREFLADVAGTLAVTLMAKWKTTAQMVAIGVLFAHGIAEHHAGLSAVGMDPAMVAAVLSGKIVDTGDFGWWLEVARWFGVIGLALLWLAAILTVWTGMDYFRKAVPHLKEPE